MASSIAGFGTRFVGQRDYQSDGSYVTTEFVTALYLPLVPLRSFRVVETGYGGGASAGYFKTTYLAHPRPLCWAQVATIYATIVLCTVSFVLYMGYSRATESHTPSHQHTLGDLVPKWQQFERKYLEE